MSRLLLSGMTLVLAGCHLLASHDIAKTAFDFGVPPTAETQTGNPLSANVVVTNIVAPGWMDNSSMYYRLTYRNAANPLPYANSQWVMSPAALLTQRLRWTLGASNEGGSGRGRGRSNRESFVLRSELIEFEQIFDRPTASHGVLRLRATLEQQRDARRTQRTFTIEKPAPTPDAIGGVKALSLCADELSNAVTEWIIGELSGSRSNSDLPSLIGPPKGADHSD
jgi:cholesterol transport system auxiliary component